MRRAAIAWISVTVLGVPGFAAGPALEDGPAEPGTWGCRPVDGQKVPVNPPGFVWRVQKDAVGYDFQCSRDERFLVVSAAADGLAHNAHCPSRLLAEGRWYWRYRAIWKAGGQSEWSRPRSFFVDREAVEFPMPSKAEIGQRIPQRHPRLFVRPENLDALRQGRTGDRASHWAQLVRSIEPYVAKPVEMAEPRPYSSGRRQNNKEDIDLWRKNRGIVVQAVSRAADLAFAYLVSGEERYGRRAADYMTRVADLPPDGPTSYRYNDECAMPIMYELSRAYTWGYEALTPDQREKIRQVMRIRGNEVYTLLTDRLNHLWRPYNSHSNRAWHFLGEMGVAFYREIPEAADWVDFALRVFFCSYPAWSDEDGGWHEGAAYWCSYMNRVTWWLDVMREALGVDGYRKPFFSRVGDLAMYTAVPGARDAGLGDGADGFSASRLGGLMHVFARQMGNGHWQWYADTTGKMESGYLGYLRAGLPRPVPKDPSDLPTAKLFRGVGVAHLHTNLTDAEQDIHLTFKSSPLGSQSHGFNAQNSFLLSVYGEPLICWSGHRDWHGSAHHQKWMWQTRSQNCILVNGTGQIPHSISAQGRITGFSHNSYMDLVSGECGAAYAGRLEGWERTILFAKTDLIIVLDDVACREDSAVEWLLHTGGRLRRSAERVVEVVGEKSRCDVTFLAPKELTFAIADGFGDLPPVGSALKQQHLSAATTVKCRRVQFLTVLTPRRAERSEKTEIAYQPVDGGHACRLSDADRTLVVLWQPDDEGRILEAYEARSSDRVYARLSSAANSKVIELRHGTPRRR